MSKDIITKDNVKKVAELSRIHLEEDKMDGFTSTLEEILEYVAKLNNLDVSQVEPTSHVLPLENVHREDVVVPSLSQTEALNISVEQKEGSFKVPKVIE